MSSFPKFDEIRLAAEATPLPHSISDLLKSAEEKFGDATAIRFFEDETSLTFRQLGAQVRRLASSLAGIGIKPGEVVAVMLENRIEFPVTWLALGELGAVVCPVIASYTPRELKFLIQDAGVTHLVVQDKFLPVAEALSPDERPAASSIVVVADGDFKGGYSVWNALAARGQETFQANHVGGGEDLYSIQYTSGTTGMPKGVRLSHRFWMQAGIGPVLTYPTLGLKTILSDHPFHYIDPQWMLIAGLYTGGVTDFSKRMSVSRFRQWIRKYKPDLSWLPDPLLQLPLGPEDGPLPSKLFLAYGFSREMVEEAERRFKVAVRECYGMTEIGMGLVVPADLEDPDVVGTCGIPAPWRECRIVDAQGNDLPDGEAGELWVSGPGMCLGYHNRPEANQETFVNGWFRTGDLFVREENGCYRIVGRLKDMVKRNGENIAAAEVERTLVELPDVVEAAVVPVPDPERDEEVKVYLRLRPGLTKDDVSPELVLEHCSQRLAKFKWPRYIAYIEEFPYTSSEKIAKHTLVAGQADLRLGAYDAVDKVWR